MALNPGKQDRVILETTTGAGSTSREGSVQSDSLMATLWVANVSSGTLTANVYTLTDVGREVLVCSFPVISAGTTSLLLKKSGVTMQRFRVQVDYTGICTYEVYIRAIEGIGEGSTKILGSDGWSVAQLTVNTGTAIILIPSALTDRQGLVIRNWSQSGQNIFLGDSVGDTTTGTGYPLGPTDSLAIDLASGVAVYVTSDAAAADVRYAQAGG